MKSMLRLAGAVVPMAASLFAQMSVTLTPSVPSPAPLGTAVEWTATVSNGGAGTLFYRFRTSRLNRIPTQFNTRSFLTDGYLNSDEAVAGTFRTVVDYGPKSSFTWSPIDREGSYQVEVSVKNNDTGETAFAVALYRLTPLADGTEPVITPTSHPLVFIYSAPPCPERSRMRVEFRSADGTAQDTPSKACDSRHSMNFYLAGLRANAEYTAQQILGRDGSTVAGPALSFETGDIPLQTPPATPLTSAVPSTDRILLQSVLQTRSIATDLSGNVVWYGPPGISFLTRPEKGGTFMGIFEDGSQNPSRQFVREFDFLGNTIVETNAARVNEQLAAMGVHPINAFHHEARKMPGGGYLVLAATERMLTGVQGPGPVDILGDTVLVLDSNLQVTWAWDAFDHLDPHRTAILGEKCKYPAGLVCAPFYLSDTVNDWLHGNSLQLTPDGNILFSLRHQDWIIKIDYENGLGSGDILWRLGKDGDFQMNSSDPFPWFSHQHDANVEPDNTTLAVFDDGNTRVASDPAGHSRGQVLQIDETNRTATLLLNGDLGTYSYALGSAQRLPNGDYHFDSGLAADPSGHGGMVAQSLELNMSGQMVYGIQFGALEYRSFRMPDLYTAP